MINDQSTIVALASAVGVSSVAVIRLSGPESLSIASKCLYKTKEVSFNTVYYGVFSDPVKNKPIDQVCYFLFKGPKSFTGEDIVEIQCHGSSYVIKAILSICATLGARLAQPGEFTKRAFVNGKLNLTQAESIIDLIHSESKLQHQISLNRVEGKLYSHIKQFRATFMSILEQVEGSIDFPEEVPPIDREVVASTITELTNKLNSILELQDYGKVIENGFHCVLVGVPNVGKSSLFNALLNQDRSIVTEIPGTTRDYISEKIEYNGLQFHFYDTAGLRDAKDTVEYLGIKKVTELLNKADLILVLTDKTEESTAILKTLSSYKNKALVYTKADLFTYSLATNSEYVFQLTCSVTNERSIQELKRSIHKRISVNENTADLELMCNIRQQDCLQKMHHQCSHLLTNLSKEYHDDVFSIELRQCVELCSELAGDSLTEEVLDGIFSRFCVGK
jgi:tRNA modification GTPase